MSERLSTGLRNWMLGYGSMREALQDCVMKIYSGSAPAEADDAVTGVLLATVTKSSGTVTGGYWNNGLLGERSIYNTWKMTLDGDHATGNTCKFTINHNSAGAVAYTYTNTPDQTAEGVLLDIIQVINDLGFVKASPGVVASHEIIVRCTMAGDDIVIADNTGDITVTPLELDVEARVDTLFFALPSSGAMSKGTDTWSGLIATSGVAGYFRIVKPEDDGTDSSTPIRFQGAVSTSGAELNLSTTSLVAATTLTIDTFSISLPAE